MYTQNGELIYPSDSEESVPPTSTSNADNQAVTPHSNPSLSPAIATSKPPHSDRSLSPIPAKNLKLHGSPPCLRTDNFSPRYSPQNMNHIDSGHPPSSVSQHDSHTSAVSSHSAVSNHIDSLNSVIPPSQASQPDNRSGQGHQDALAIPQAAQSTHLNSLGSQSMASTIPHQIYKTSSQASPTTVIGGYMPSVPNYHLNSQYPHNLPLLNQSQSRY